MKIDVPAGYEELGLVLEAALRQAAVGKGTRHVDGNNRWTRQDTLAVIVPVAREGFLVGQSMKKIIESSRMAPVPAARELLGAMNYLATLIYHLSEANSANALMDFLKGCE